MLGHEHWHHFTGERLVFRRILSKREAKQASTESRYVGRVLWLHLLRFSISAGTACVQLGGQGRADQRQVAEPALQPKPGF